MTANDELVLLYRVFRVFGIFQVHQHRLQQGKARVFNIVILAVRVELPGLFL